MGGPTFDRQVFVKKQQKQTTPTRSLLPGGLVLLLVAALASFATYRYVKAGGSVAPNPADTAKIKELQTKLTQAQARVEELEKRRHVSAAKRATDLNKSGNAVAPVAVEAKHAMLAKVADHPASHMTDAPYHTASSPAVKNSHSINGKTAPVASNAPPSLSATDQATIELKTQLANAQAASNKRLAALQNGLTANHEDWQATTNRLGNVVGEVDSQKTAIRKNQNSVNYLLEREHRSDVSFTLKKGAGLQRVGPISMKLASTSVKGQHYSIRMIVDDKSVELKDRALNEVVEFYTSRSKYPLRLIVSQIERGQVSGTLAVPFALGQEANNPQLHELQER
jgi:hypothetical protein